MANENVFNVLQERGLIQQVTNSEALKNLLEKNSVTFYVGIDPTADSLHAGHLLPIMGMMNMQRHGHKPIAIIGGGTAMIGDPSGKIEMRKILTREQIAANAEKIKKQLGRYLNFEGNQAIFVDNYEWLSELKYIEFLRDIGKHFSVNRMLSFETFRRRLETGLTFLEFNYQLLQAYDFLVLNRRYNCLLQMGGDDQWANIIAGADLIRRLEGKETYGMTFPLLVTASGAKMGKTESGALWLDPTKTSPYEYYQYWVNVADSDLVKFLYFFTLLPGSEIKQVQDQKDAALNAAKSILAYEATKLAHGEKRAQEALSSSMAAFGKRDLPKNILPSSSIHQEQIRLAEDGIPKFAMTVDEIKNNPKIISLLHEQQLVASRSEARRLIQQGGLYVQNERIQDVEARLNESYIADGKIIIRLGKKKHFQIIII